MNLRILLLILVLSSSAHADLGTPRSAVEATIRYAQEDKIVGVDIESLKTKPRHSWTKTSLLKYLKDIDPRRLIFEAKDKEKNIYWFSQGDSQSLVRLIAPQRIDFEVSWIKDTSNRYGGSYIITGIHP